MHTKNIGALLIAVALIVGAIIYLDSGKVSPGTTSESAPIVAVPTTSAEEGDAKGGTVALSALDLKEKEAKYERAKEITTPDGFINTSTPSTDSGQEGSVQAPLTIGELIGKKVILLDIWTYSCINCQRTIPYLNSWEEKYGDKGLVIIGLHTPEFEFEKNYDNVLSAVKKFGIKYPVVLDNDYSTWHAYKNQYWPRHYLIDIDGFIVADHIGEGGYEETERDIQKALAERAVRLGENTLADMPVTKEMLVPHAESPETYFGANRNEYLANGEKGRVGVQTFLAPGEVTPNRLYLGGGWNMLPEYAENTTGSATITFRYQAKEVYFVASSETGIDVEIYQDGKLVRGKGAVNCKDAGFCGGEDVGLDGTVHIKEDRLYKLIQNQGPEAHTLQIKIPKAGLKAFTFTFG